MDVGAKLKEIRKFGDTEKLYDPSKYNESIRNAWIQIWVRNSFRNWNFIYEKYKDENRDVSVLKEKETRPVAIVGSGPSLNDWDELWDDWKGAVMCSSSHLKYFNGIGRTPDYCVIIDADPAMPHLVTEADTTKTTLLTHPQMDPPILEGWDGPIYFFRMLDPGDDWFSKYVPMGYSVMNPYNGSGVKSFVLNSGNVVNTMIALSQYIGMGNIFLCGYDLGYPDDVYRFTDFEKKDGEWVRKPSPPLTKEMWAMMGHNGVKTDKVNCFYKYSTFVLYGLDNSNIFSCSRGIVDEIPYVKPKDVIACQGNVADGIKVADKDKYKISQEYLRKRGMYIIKRLTKTIFKIKSNPKIYKKLKKLVCRFMLFTTRFRKMEPALRVQTKKNIRRSVLKSPKLNVRLLWDLFISPEFIELQRPPRVGVTNKYSVKGLAKLKLVWEFNIGRWLRWW